MPDTSSNNHMKFGETYGFSVMSSVLFGLAFILYPVICVLVSGISGAGYFATGFGIYLACALFAFYVIPYGINSVASILIQHGRYKETFSFFRVSLLIALLCGMVLSGVAFFTANRFARVMMQAPAGAVAIKMLLPTFLLLPIVGVIRSILQVFGLKKVILAGQLLELVFGGAASFVFSKLLYDQGWRMDIVKSENIYRFAYGSGGAALGIAVGIAVSLILYIVFALIVIGHLKRQTHGELPPKKKYHPVAKAFWNSIPLGMLVLLIGIVPLISQSIIGNFMVRTMKESSYVAEWGLFSIGFQFLVVLPILFTITIAMQVIPIIRRPDKLTQSARMLIVYRVRLANRLAALCAIPLTLLLPAIASNLIPTIYPTLDDISVPVLFLIAGCPTVLMIALAGASSAIMVGIGENYRLSFHAVLCFGAFVAFSEFLLRSLHMGIYSTQYGFIMFGILLTTLNILHIDATLRTRQEWKRYYLIPLLAGVVAAILTFAAGAALGKVIHIAPVILLIQLVIFVIVVTLVYAVFRVLDQADFYEIPGGDRVMRILGALHLVKVEE